MRPGREGKSLRKRGGNLPGKSTGTRLLLARYPVQNIQGSVFNKVVFGNEERGARAKIGFAKPGMGDLFTRGGKA